MILEEYVSFEIAKLLKKKGFDERCTHYYKNEKYLVDLGYTNIHSHTNSDLVEEFAAPTLQMAIKWLREVHDIFIKLEFNVDEDVQWHPSLALIKGNKYIHTNELQWYDTYEQACESACIYALKNLI